MSKKFLPEQLSKLSRNNFIKRLKWKNWRCVSGVDFPSDKDVLLKDALRNLQINGKFFRQSNIFLNLSPKLQAAAQSSNPSDLNPAFKLFVKTELFPNLSDASAEQEYEKLQNAYGQPIAGNILSAANESACGRFVNQPNITASIRSRIKVDNLTYKYGTYFLDSCITDLIYSHCDINSLDRHYEVTLPTTINYGSSMSSVQTSFASDYLQLSNSYGEALALQEQVDVPKLVELENEIQTTKLIDEYYNACEKYKNILKKSLFTELEDVDPVFAKFLKTESLMLQVDSVLIDSPTGLPSSANVIAKGKETGLDNLVSSLNMEEKIIKFSKPAQLAVRKYKVMCEMQKTLRATDELGLDTVRNFAGLLTKNAALLKTSRDTGIETFFKMVASIATLGIAAPFLFSTHGHEFIETVSTVFDKKRYRSGVQKVTALDPANHVRFGYSH